MSGDLEGLEAIVAHELSVGVLPSVDTLARELARLHGDTLLGVLFYGSCLRQTTDEGVLDYWLVVDDYGRAYRNRLHALINHIAPPNVFYLEWEFEGRTLRTKYGVIDRADFARGTSFRALHPYVFARFAQPARLLACRDDEARRYFTTCVARSILVMVHRLVFLLPRRSGWLRFSLAAFWHDAFRRSYDSERRPEADETIRGHYLASADRYDEVGALAIRWLASEGRLDEVVEHPRSFAIRVGTGKLLSGRLRWQLMRILGRSLGLVRLFKTAYTFGDWVPYVLWKLERHTGRKFELSERQRRHPFVFAWPVILRQIVRRNLR